MALIPNNKHYVVYCVMVYSTSIGIDSDDLEWAEFTTLRSRIQTN